MKCAKASVWSLPPFPSSFFFVAAPLKMSHRKFDFPVDLCCNLNEGDEEEEKEEEDDEN